MTSFSKLPFFHFKRWLYNKSTRHAWKQTLFSAKSPKSSTSITSSIGFSKHCFRCVYMLNVLSTSWQMKFRSFARSLACENYFWRYRQYYIPTREEWGSETKESNWRRREMRREALSDRPWIRCTACCLGLPWCEAAVMVILDVFLLPLRRRKGSPEGTIGESYSEKILGLIDFAESRLFGRAFFRECKLENPLPRRLLIPRRLNK